MRILKSILGTIIFFFIFISLQTSFSSCEKETIKIETVTDTLYIKDTVRIVDTINLSCYDLTDGLVAYYNFNNGNLNDSSGKGNNIIFSNAVKTSDRFGKTNNAYLFNGTNSYMRVANSASLNPKGAITLMGVVKMNDFYSGICHGNQIFQKGTKDQDQGVYSLRVTFMTSDCYANVDTSKEVAFGFYGDYGYVSGASDISHFINTNTWLTIVYTYDGSESKIYINGQLRNKELRTAVFNPNVADLFIGRAESSVYPYWWNGAIDEIRVYNKALSEGAVKELSSLKN